MMKGKTVALRLTFNLAELLLEVDSKAKRKALAPFVRNDFIKREFGNRVIDEIKDRTLSGKDKRDNNFVPYSKTYKESLPFQVFGKSSRVNLKLSGQMQASINVLSTKATTVTIGFISQTQDQKATGHVNGSGPLPVRDFWGIKKSDQVKILKGVIRDFNSETEGAQFAEALADLGQQVTIEGELFKGDEPIQNLTLTEDSDGS